MRPNGRSEPNPYRCRLRLLSLFVCLFPILLSTASVAAGPLPEFSAHYELRRNGLFLGEMSRQLMAVDGDMRFISSSRTRGLIAWLFPDRIEEETRWHYVAGRPRPELYRYEHRGRSKHRLVEIHFDWKRHVAVHTVNGEPWKLRITDDVQDKLVYQLTLMLDLAAGVEEPRYAIADGGKLKDYHFKRVGREILETPLGRLETIRIIRLDDKRGTTIWCAPTYGYLPVRIAQTDTDGSHLVLDIRDEHGIVPSPATKGRLVIPSR